MNPNKQRRIRERSLDMYSEEKSLQLEMLGDVKTFSTKEVSEMTGLSESTIRKHVRKGLLKNCSDTGNSWRYTYKQIQDYIRRLELGDSRGTVDEN